MDSTFDGATVFSATMHRERDALGERITAWLALHPKLAPVDTVVALSSDSRFHCLTIVVFWRWLTLPGAENPAALPAARHTDLPHRS